MEVDFALLADAVSARPDGKLDIYGAGFDTVNTLAVPARHASMTLALRFLLSRQEAQNEHRLDVYLVHGDGDEVARVQGQLGPVLQERLDAIPAGRRIGVMSILQFTNVVLPSFGPYHFAIHWDGNEARTPIALFVERPPGGEQAAAEDSPGGPSAPEE